MTLQENFKKEKCPDRGSGRDPWYGPAVASIAVRTLAHHGRGNTALACLNQSEPTKDICICQKNFPHRTDVGPVDVLTTTRLSGAVPTFA